jgi:hypothetical protein
MASSVVSWQVSADDEPGTRVALVARELVDARFSSILSASHRSNGRLSCHGGPAAWQACTRSRAPLTSSWQAASTAVEEITPTAISGRSISRHTARASGRHDGLLECHLFPLTPCCLSPLCLLQYTGSTNSWVQLSSPSWLAPGRWLRRTGWQYSATEMWMAGQEDGDRGDDGDCADCATKARVLTRDCFPALVCLVPAGGRANFENNDIWHVRLHRQ